MNFDMNVHCWRVPEAHTFYFRVVDNNDMADAWTCKVGMTLAPLPNPLTVMFTVTEAALIIVNVFTKAIQYV
jgi:hypothetical protein